jgi:hypothetical protein
VLLVPTPSLHPQRMISMGNSKPYPKYPPYLTYEKAHLEPTVLEQEFPIPAFSRNEVFYPPHLKLDKYFENEDQKCKFGAAQFFGFLQDTVEVEHCLVIPAVAAVRRLPYEIPAEAEQHLNETVTDEGFHAEQSSKYLNKLKSYFQLSWSEEQRLPLFLRRLEKQREAASNAFHRDLITVLNGVVTETRISIELSRFANDNRLTDTVRQICRLHAKDEAIHASQFKALCTWLWQVFDRTTREVSSKFLIDSMVARSMPDFNRLTNFLHQSTGKSSDECAVIITDEFTAESLVEEMQIAAKPTIAFLEQLGVFRLAPLDEAFAKEIATQKIALKDLREEALRRLSNRSISNGARGSIHE